MTPRTVRRLFLAVLIVLPIQYGLVGLVDRVHGEPWPTLVLPAFQSTGERGGATTLDHVALEAVFADSTQTRVPTAHLLPELPASQHLGFFRTQCRPAVLSGTQRTERCLRPEAATWLADRVTALFPDRTPRRLDVAWSRMRYLPPGEADSASVHLTPLDTLSIRW